MGNGWLVRGRVWLYTLYILYFYEEERERRGNRNSESVSTFNNIIISSQHPITSHYYYATGDSRMSWCAKKNADGETGWAHNDQLWIYSSPATAQYTYILLVLSEIRVQLADSDSLGYYYFSDYYSNSDMALILTENKNNGMPIKRE